MRWHIVCFPAVIFPFSLQPEIDLDLEMFFELVPELNAVSLCLLIAKKTGGKKKKRCKDVISFVGICPDLNTDAEKKEHL